MRQGKEKKIICCLCGKKISDVMSNDAWPIISGRCCSKCNDTIVVPARLSALYEELRTDARKE